MGVSNPRDDLAERNLNVALVPLSTVISKVGNAHLQQNPNIGFFFLHNTTEKLPFTLLKILFHALFFSFIMPMIPYSSAVASVQNVLPYMVILRAQNSRVTNIYF